LLTAQDLTVNGLAPFDLTIEAGECVALTGASGSGKTLVLRALADLDPGAGEVTLDGHSRTAIAAPDWRRRVTGQILAGVDPVEAVKYQIMIFFLIASGTGIGVFLAVYAGARRLSDSRHRLRLDRLRPAA